MQKWEQVDVARVVQAAEQIVALPQKLSSMTVKDLEMMPKLEELRRLETIPVGGTTNISEEVIAAIVSVATKEVPGVADVGISSFRQILAERLGGSERKARGVSVEAGRREAIVDITMKMTYGYSIPNTIIAVRQNVADRLIKLCGLIAKEVNIRISSLEFPERMPGRVQ